MPSTNAADLNGAGRKTRSAGLGGGRGRLALRLTTVAATVLDVLLSPLTRWLALAGAAGLVAVFAYALSTHQYRAALIDAQLDGLLTKAEVLAAALAADRAGGARATSGNPGGILALAPLHGQGATVLDPDRAQALMAALAEPRGVRALVFGVDGTLIADSRGAGDGANPLATAPGDPPGPFGRTVLALDRFLGTDVPLVEPGADLRPPVFAEIADALDGIPAAAVRRWPDGRLVMTAAVPVRRDAGTLGALVLTAVDDEVTPVLAAERRDLVEGFALGLLLIAAIAALSAGTVIVPLRRLQRKVRRARTRAAARTGLSAETVRQDVIGDIERDLALTTGALNDRIRALEAFSAELAHELKNPLTSLNSAVETLPRADRPGQRDKLLAIMAHDVRRLDRLIADISAATSLDRDLSALADERVEILPMVKAVVSVEEELAARKGQTVALAVGKDVDPDRLVLTGSASRLGEVLTNLLDNARSFSPEGGRIEVRLADRGAFVEIRVDDDGPGIRPEMKERIFERFYTDRPDIQGFGDNSGLGLAICRQIVAAHGGEVFAENRMVRGPSGEMEVAGARFTVRLPLREP